jgi:hypothetical protein
LPRALLTDHTVWVPAIAGTTKDTYSITSATRPIALRSIRSRIAAA